MPVVGDDEVRPPVAVDVARGHRLREAAGAAVVALRGERAVSTGEEHRDERPSLPTADGYVRPAVAVHIADHEPVRAEPRMAVRAGSGSRPRWANASFVTPRQRFRHATLPLCCVRWPSTRTRSGR